MEIRDAARRWVDVLGVAWPNRDIERCLTLYTPDAIYRGPFGEVEPAAEHLRMVFALGDAGPEVWLGEPLVADGRVAFPWWAVIEFDGMPTTFVATEWVRFDDEGLVVEEHADWTSTHGRIEPWPGWG